MKRHKKNAHGEDGFMGKPFKKEKVDVGEAKSLEGQNEFKAEMNGGRDQDETMEEERELEDNLTKSAPNNIQVVDVHGFVVECLDDGDLVIKKFLGTPEEALHRAYLEMQDFFLETKIKYGRNVTSACIDIPIF